ncbi:MAG: hypothetical protein QM280_00140, partial [Bacteroidota bacterium]|nr:hypothetical protein [Bacteroidota bacterium]
ILETDSKKRPVAQKSYSGVMGFRMARGKYSDALLSAIFKKIFKRLNLIDFTVNHPVPLVAGMAKYFLNNELNVAFAELFNNGFLLFLKKKDANGKLTGIKYIRKAQATQSLNEWTYDGQELEIFYSDTYEIFGVSDAVLLKDTLKAIDNSLNASQTVIKRLGAVIVGTPEQPAQNPQMVQIDKDTKDLLEKDTQNDYGMLDEQKQFMFLRRPLKLQRIALGGKDLLITENVEMFTKILCDNMDIPYDVMAMSGQSTFANQEQAEKSMQDTAEAFISKIWTFFNVMNISFDWTVNNNKYGKK